MRFHRLSFYRLSFFVVVSVCLMLESCGGDTATAPPITRRTTTTITLFSPNAGDDIAVRDTSPLVCTWDTVRDVSQSSFLSYVVTLDNDNDTRNGVIFSREIFNSFGTTTLQIPRSVLQTILSFPQNRTSDSLYYFSVGVITFTDTLVNTNANQFKLRVLP
jgi:hypothetical protein